MNSMRQVTSVNRSYNSENNLDALLDDLQATVSRSGSHTNLNGNVSGFREVRRTVTDGTPEGTSTEYHIEYLDPANSTTHVTETSYSPTSFESSRQVKELQSSFKSSSTSKVHGSEVKDLRLKKNISELDSLLDDLNASNRSTYDSSTVVSKNFDGGFSSSGPISTSTPGKYSSYEEKRFREEKTLRGRSPSPRRDLVFTGPRSRDPSPSTLNTVSTVNYSVPEMPVTDISNMGGPRPVRQEVYRYEKTTTTRTTPPVITEVRTDLPGGAHQITYAYPSVLDGSAANQSLEYRPQSPSGTKSVHYSSTVTNSRSTNDDYPPRRPPSPIGYPQRSSRSIQQSNSWVRESRSDGHHREHRSEVRQSPPPHRSPSPVSMPSPPMPRSNKFGYDGSVVRPRSPTPPHKTHYYHHQHHQPVESTVTTHTYSVSPSPGHQAVTYKTYTTTSSKSYSQDESRPRPFPVSRSPTPELQQPPKKIEELMKTFENTEEYRRHESSSSRYDSHRTDGVHHRRTTSHTSSGSPVPIQHQQKVTPTPPASPKSIMKERTVRREEESRNISGPPVYYPPGELFTKKEESSMAQANGGGKYKAKAKYEYEAKSKSKSKESSGKAVVPVCLPLCCAMPCSIM